MKDKHNALFSTAVLAWGKKHSRQHFPWQVADFYKVWVSEVMLQQTQTKTVEKYFAKFILRFPTVSSLANANLAEVMLLWSGLGYYRRAKNLHLAAQMITLNQMPTDLDGWLDLPGVGRSTAGAIISLTTDKPEIVLDANVARVIHRCVLGVAKKKIDQLSWTTALSLLPKENGRLYSQSMMDLGATICQADVQRCGDCPLAKQCQWFGQGKPDIGTDAKTAPKPKRSMNIDWIMYVHTLSREIYLQPSVHQQQHHGAIWPNLWLPLQDTKPVDRLADARTLDSTHQSIDIVHHLTHKKLNINCRVITVSDKTIAQPGEWVNVDNVEQIVALPSVVKKIIKQIGIISELRK